MMRETSSYRWRQRLLVAALMESLNLDERRVRTITNSQFSLSSRFLVFILVGYQFCLYVLGGSHSVGKLLERPSGVSSSSKAVFQLEMSCLNIPLLGNM